MRHAIAILALVGAIMFGAASYMPTTTTVYQRGFSNIETSEFHYNVAKLDKGDTLHIYTTGKGGNAQTCIAMINEILDAKKRGVKVVTEIGGEAYSGNAFIWLAGDERIVHDGDLIMFHKAAIYDLYGKKVEDLDEDMQFMIDTANDFILKFTRLRVEDTETFEDMFDGQMNYFTGRQLYDLGVATKLIGAN